MSWDPAAVGRLFSKSEPVACNFGPHRRDGNSSASGETLSLAGGWHREGQRLQFGIAHGRYDANAKFFDSATQGNLFGEVDISPYFSACECGSGVVGRSDEGVGERFADGRSGRAGGV